MTLRVGEAARVFLLVMIGYVLAVVVLHGRYTTSAVQALSDRVKRLAGELEALQAADASVGAAATPALPGSDGSSALDCCALARRYSVVAGSNWGTLPAKLRRWWDDYKCNEVAGGRRCDDARGASSDSAGKLDELRRELAKSRAREARLEAELRGAASGGERRAPWFASGRRRGVVMSCPSGRQGSHNPGSWKPSDPFAGVTAVAEQLAALNSSLELVFVHFSGDGSDGRCRELKDKVGSRLALTCHSADEALPSGYGVAKVEAVLQAPLDEVIWLDCDTFLVGDLETLLDGPLQARTGATFWADIEGHFDSGRQLRELFARERVNTSLFPLDSWRVTTGFDSGILVVDKRRCAGVLARLKRMALNFNQAWSSYTHGDKDLWHLAWMLHNQDFAYVPYVGAIGSFVDRKFHMTAQAKFDMRGRVVVAHQLWRDYPLPKANFHGAEWPALTPEHGGSVRYNPPDLTLRFDLRQNREFRYARMGNKFPEHLRSRFDSSKSDWEHIINGQGFGPDNMFASSNNIHTQVARAAKAWGY